MKNRNMNMEVKQIFIILTVMCCVVGGYVMWFQPGLDKKALVGKWYQMNIEENTYDRTEYFEFFADDTFQTGSGEVGSFNIENHSITFRIDDMGTLTLPYKIKYEGRTPKALELTGKKGTTTFINENAVR